MWYDGGPERLRERERLSGFLLQFSLKEAVSTSPFTGFATVTAELLDRFVEDLVPLPLQPMRVPGDPRAIGLHPAWSSWPPTTGEVVLGSALAAGNAAPAAPTRPP